MALYKLLDAIKTLATGRRDFSRRLSQTASQVTLSLEHLKHDGNVAVRQTADR